MSSDPDRPTLSIVLCMHNGHDFFSDTVRFIEQQPYKDYEIIFVVTSTSTDGSIEDAEDYCSKNDNCRTVIQTERTRLGGAKNLGIDNAKGKYIWFLDVDDTQSLDILQRMMKSLESSGAQTCICNFIYTADRNPIKKSEVKEDIILTGKMAVHARSLNLIPVTSWSMIYDLDTIRESGVRFSETMSEDIGFTYRILDHCETVCVVPDVLYGYYINPSSFCNTDEDLRGRTESKAYIGLVEYFPSENSYLMRRLKLMVMRSFLHMSRQGFKEEIKHEELKSVLSKDLKSTDRFEYWVARHFPNAYHTTFVLFAKFYYYKPGRAYITNSKQKTLRRISEGR